MHEPRYMREPRSTMPSGVSLTNAPAKSDSTNGHEMRGISFVNHR